MIVRLVSLVVLLWPAAVTAVDLGLLPGTLANVTGLCGDPAPVSVQLIGSEFSPLIDLPAGEVVEVSLSRGAYSVTVTRRDGSTVEEASVLIGDPGFRLFFGCRGPQPRGAAGRPWDTPVRFANTTGDCGDPRRVEFWVDGRLAAGVGPGASVDGRLPGRDVALDVVSDGRRVASTWLATVHPGRVIFHGCTDPDPPGEGIAIAFQNTTDACPDPLERRHLTLWIDQAPRLGLPPGGKGVAWVSRGRHDIRVLVGNTREKVVSGTRDVVAPFRVRYGCGREEQPR